MGEGGYDYSSLIVFSLRPPSPHDANTHLASLALVEQEHAVGQRSTHGEAAGTEETDGRAEARENGRAVELGTDDARWWGGVDVDGLWRWEVRDEFPISATVLSLSFSLSAQSRAGQSGAEPGNSTTAGAHARRCAPPRAR